MPYHRVAPEVAGEWGEDTIADSDVHPPVVTRLHYEFQGWLGDALLESFPCFIVTEAARRRLEAERLTGIAFADVKISKSDLFKEMHPGRKLPRFFWLKVPGVAGQDDFGINPDASLVVSARALSVLRELGISNADVSDWTPSP